MLLLLVNLAMYISQTWLQDLGWDTSTLVPIWLLDWLLITYSCEISTGRDRAFVITNPSLFIGVHSCYEYIRHQLCALRMDTLSEQFFKK